MESSGNLFKQNFTSLSNLLERDTIGSEILIYGTSSVMLMVAYAKRRPWYLVRPFTKPSHIPDQLIKEGVKHTGIICDVQQKGHDTVLLASHRPWIPLFASNTRLLPIKLVGVKVTGNGIAWLQNSVIGHKATFVPLQKHINNEYVVSQVFIVNTAKKEYLLDISESLLKLRFAHFEKDIDEEAIKPYIKYYKHLEKVDTKASRREKWFQLLARYPTFWQSFHNLKSFLLSKQKLLPDLIR